MASSGKKSKTKWKPLETAEVIASTRLPVHRKTSSWAEDPELDHNDYDYSRKVDNISLPTAPRAARGLDDDANIPQDPPFVAFLTNLPYELNEDELSSFFQDLQVNVKIKSVTLPREDRTNKVRGYGYVEFEDRVSFVKVMSESSEFMIKGRRVRIDVSTDKGDGRGGRGMRSGGGSEPDYMSQNWRASGPPADRDDDAYKRRDYGDRGGYGRRDRDDRRGGFGDRDRDRDRDRGYRDRGFRGDDNREWSRDGDRDRGGGGGGGGGGNWRDRDDRDRGGSYGRSNYEERRNETGSWRRDREEHDRERRSPERSEPKSRPKIMLKPRTKPIEEDNKESDTTAAIFGGAKPVNTAAREREIEERLARQSATTEDSARRKGPSSQDSWDRDKDHTQDKDRDRDHGDRERERDRDRGDRDKDRGRSADYHSKDEDDDYEGDYDKKSESSDRDIDTDKERVSSRGGETRGEDTQRKLEPAPPPKENAWTRRGQQSNNSAVNNGQASPSEVENQPKSRGSSPRPLTKDDSSVGEGSVRKYQPPRGQSSEQRRGDRKPHDDRSKGTPNSGRGSNTGPPVKAVSQAPARSKESKKDDREDKLRMPKFEEQKGPNFVGSNKFAFLDEANETAAN